MSVKDVAAAAGVSLGTVSNVLNRPDLVSERTRTRVEDAIADLGFVRNESARQLRSGTSRALAYVMLDGSNPFFNDVAHAIEQVADAADLSLYRCSSEQSRLREDTYLVRLDQQRVRGILLTPVEVDDDLISSLSDRRTPVVVVDRKMPEDAICSVAVDDVLGGQLAVNHLSELGHERIAYVGGPSHIGQVRDRLEGAVIAASGAASTEIIPIETQRMSVDEGRLAAQKLAGLPVKQRPTAAFCANDLLALGLLQQCAALGLRVPSDLAIVGYDDIEFAGAAAVPLTSVRQPRGALGITATELLLDEVSNDDHRHQHVSFRPELIVRDSTIGKAGGGF